MSENTEQVIIIGSGPAGLTAGIYTSRSAMKPLLFTGSEIGGQVNLTMEVENYPGFPDGITGPELVQRMQKQAERFGCRVIVDTVTEVKLDEHPFVVKTQSGREHRCKALIITTGANPRRLGVPGEKELTGRGVSYCATCDGFFFRGKEVAVVGGGDAAIEEAIFLTRYVNKVRVIHRRDQLRADKILADRLIATPNVEVVWDTIVKRVVGDELGVKAVDVHNKKTGEDSTFNVDGFFIFIGLVPNNNWIKDAVACADDGFILTDENLHTDIPGVFAAGDVRHKEFRQITTAVSDGAMAARGAENYLQE